MPPTRPLLPLLFALAWLALPAPARADDGNPPETSRFFETYDRNRDGAVTQEEFEGSREVFRLLDADKDGKVTPPELGLPADFRPDPDAARRRERAARDRAGRGGRGGQDRAARLKRALARMDANGDGAVSKAEWKGNPNAFERFDRNGDGKIDRTDLPRLLGAGGGDGGMAGPQDGTKPTGPPDATRGGPRPNKSPRTSDKTAPPEAPEGAAPSDPGSAGPGRPARRITPEQAAKRFAKLDTDGDQALTEADGIGPGLLGKMDADGDGKVSLAEFQAAVEEAQAKRRRGATGAGAPRRMDPKRAARMLRRFDTDRDGKVSKGEFPGSDERFQRMDADGDGFLTPHDFK